MIGRAFRRIHATKTSLIESFHGYWYSHDWNAECISHSATIQIHGQSRTDLDPTKQKIPEKMWKILIGPKYAETQHPRWCEYLMSRLPCYVRLLMQCKIGEFNFFLLFILDANVQIRLMMRCVSHTIYFDCFPSLRRFLSAGAARAD